METLFGVSMDTIMLIVLSMSIFVLAIVAFLAWRKPIIAKLALRNVPRRRAQTVLIIFGLMLATMLITAAFGTGDTMTYSMRVAFTGGLGGTDIQVAKANPQAVNFSGPPDFNRPSPTFNASLLDVLKAKWGTDDRIDGWAPSFEQIGPIIDTTTNQGSGQTFVQGITTDLAQTMGALNTTSGQPFDVASLKDNEVLLDKAAADKLDGKVGDSVRYVIQGKPYEMKVRDIIVNTSPSTQFPNTFVTLKQAQTMFNAPGQLTAVQISLKGGPLEGTQYSGEVAKKLDDLLDDTYEVSEVKKSALDTANLIGNFFTTVFIGIALFSIAAGILLIILIFTMLAAERKSEMGMARAVGIQRGDLTRMFIIEGMAYDLVAAAVGSALGVAIGFAMVGIISSLLGTFGFSLTPHVEIRSLIVAYCLGMLITFFTVAISASRVSSLNIVSAIRNIPEPVKPERKLGQRFLDAFDIMAEGRLGAGIGGIIGAIWSMIVSGPVVAVLGILMLAAGWAGVNGFLFHTGASLTIIAIGFTFRWFLNRRKVRPTRRDRIAFTIAGFALLVYWALPIDALHDWFGLPAFNLGIENFFVSGIMMVVGAVWVVMYNSDILLGIMSAVLGRVGRLRPVLKTAVAYPMASIFRTGMTIAMFALILFVLIMMSVLTNLNRQVDPNRPEVSGGYQIQASVSYANPVSDINARIAADPALNGKFDAVGGQTTLPLQLRQPGRKPPSTPPTAEELKANPAAAEGWSFYNVRLSDDAYLQSTKFPLQLRLKDYPNDQAVWDAIAKDPTLAVIDALPVQFGEIAEQSGGFQGGGIRGGSFFYVTGVKLSDATMDKPIEIEAKLPNVPNAKPVKLKIIGVLSRLSNFYTGVYASNEVLSQVSPIPVPTTTYFFRLKPGEDPQTLRRALGSAFLENGMEPVVISDDLKRTQAVGNGLNGLLQGFMTLGLFVGIAALGVISTRAVVERRQQIGVLRAIGYQRRMVAASFLLESSFISMLGILIGVVLGLILSYNFTEFARKDTPQIVFDVPWLQIAGIIVLSYVASLITTILPARQASQVYPAEALRYE
ncbi:MAG: putative transport system permease protein [Chloroflexia bacterium]|jgi:putative ABC transport system permease protein|nr:putative transport system permease protein [Chloroflexia bacterium]